MTTTALLLLATLPLLQEAKTAKTPVETLVEEAERIGPLVECKGTEAFLAATRGLPEIEERIVYYDSKARDARTAAEHALLDETEQARFLPSPFAGQFYYTTGYGSPLAYARALDLIGRAWDAPDVDTLSGKRIMDFGFGGIGHLRLLASLGCDVVGIDVDPLLAAYYRPEDQGTIAGPNGAEGSLELLFGHWPGDEAFKSRVGTGFDLILSKNVLKRGYVRPEQEVDPRMLIDLGVPLERFLDEVASALKPGGIFALYNICPAPREERYIPWAYGESPFTKEEFAAAGFELLAFDVDDREAVMELGWALQWDQQGQDVENDLFAWYTLAKLSSD